jgi:hypothetical protein
MHSRDDATSPVKTKAILIDAASMTVLWMNEAALQDLPESESASAAGIPVAEGVPLADILGAPEALRAAAETGLPQHMSTSLVSTSRGGVAIVASAYRLPDGNLLLLMEHTWQPGRGKAERR